MCYNSPTVQIILSGLKAPWHDCFRLENAHTQTGRLSRSSLSIGILIVQMGYKASFVCACYSDLYQAVEEGQRRKAERELWYPLYTKRTAHRLQTWQSVVDTDCLPTWALSALPDLGTAVPMRVHNTLSSPKKWKSILSPRQSWKTKMGWRHRVH